jgi:hypothetical protein
MCMDYLNSCIDQRLHGNTPEDPMGCTIGELDWLGELHHLLYEVHPDDQYQT